MVLTKPNIRLNVVSKRKRNKKRGNVHFGLESGQKGKSIHRKVKDRCIENESEWAECASDK